MTAKPKHHEVPAGTARRQYAHKKQRAAISHNPPKHWIVVADHKQAHVYHKTPKGIERIADFSGHCSKAVPEYTSEHEESLRNLAEWLALAEREKAFDRLVLIAPPETLDALHPHLEENVHGRISAALEREVAKIAEEEIEDHLTEIVWF